jgi:hypothetical protein
MKPGDKVKVIKGEYIGRVGWINKVDIINDGTYTRQKLTIEDEHKHRYLVNKDDIELLES